MIIEVIFKLVQGLNFETAPVIGDSVFYIMIFYSCLAIKRISFSKLWKKRMHCLEKYRIIFSLALGCMKHLLEE